MPYSRFYLTDLQVHTPADSQQGYGDWGGKSPNPAFAKKFIEICVERDLRVFAVTDHNRVDWYPVLREEGDKHDVFVFRPLVGDLGAVGVDDRGRDFARWSQLRAPGGAATACLVPATRAVSADVLRQADTRKQGHCPCKLWGLP